MKKVLIIANLFYASPRIPGLAKYLPEFGWQPIIITTPLGENASDRFGPPADFRKNNRVIETHGYSSSGDIGLRVRRQLSLGSKKSYSRIKPFLKFFYRRYSEIIHYPDEEKKWKPIAVKASDGLLQKEGIDVIISSSPPATAHLIVKELEKEHKIPWIADLRDLWSQNANYPYSRIRQFFDRRLEMKTLQHIDALVAGSGPAAEKLRTLHKGRKVYVITNGFDPEKMSNGKANLTPKFTITYTGQIYPKQDPTKLLAALKDLISERTLDPEDVEVRFYGPENGLLARKIEEYGLSTVVKQYGVVSRETALEKQAESQILLLLKWEDPWERGIYSGKVFEYLAAMRPILATGGSNDVVTELLNETNAGIDAQTVDDIKNALRRLYNEYKPKGRVDHQGNVEKVSKYGYREMAKRFTEVLNKITKTTSNKQV